MFNKFALVLVFLTLISGLLWLIDKFIYSYNFKKVKNNLNLKNKNIKPKFNWLQTIASLFPALTIVLIFRSFIYEPFQIPSGSMMPNLLAGDFILVKKFSYGIKDPIFNKTLIKTDLPKRGDVVVFKYPENPNLDYIKRVIGLPGDKVLYDLIEKKITIQTNCDHNNSCKEELPIQYSNFLPSKFTQTIKIIRKEEYDDFDKLLNNGIEEDKIRLLERLETIDNVQHSILTVPLLQDHLFSYYQQQNQRIAIWNVPLGQYFMLGDNRDNSSDSRYWGFVPESNLVGKAFAIWFSIEKQESGWPIRLRLNRIGLIK